MAFRFFRKSDLIAAAIVFGFMALLFLAGTIIGDRLPGRGVTLIGVEVPKSDPQYARQLWMWRAGMFAGSMFCAVLSWLCHRHSRRVAD